MARPAWFDAARLWLVLDEQAAQPRSLLEVTQLAIAGGVDVVVFRHKGWAADEILRLGVPIRELCRQTGTPFVLNHYPELVEELQPDALQLGVEDGAAGNLPLPAGMALGYSAHSVAEARARLGQGCDYCFLGPIFPTPSKAQFGAPLGLDAVQVPAELELPVVFIGGITALNLPDVVAARGQRVAVIREINSSTDPQAAAARLKALLNAAGS